MLVKDLTALRVSLGAVVVSLEIRKVERNGMG